LGKKYIEYHMKVVIFSIKFMNYIVSLVNSLSRIKELDLLLIVPKNKIDGLRKAFPQNIEIEVIEMPRYSRLSNFFLMFKILNIINRFDPDIIHIQHNGHPWFFIIFPFLRKYPIVDTIHNGISHLGEEKLRTKFFLYNSLYYSSRFITHGKKIKKQLIHNYKISADKIDVTLMGGDIQRNEGIMKKVKVNTVSQEFKDKIILFFGRVWGDRGLDYLIKAEPLISKELSNFKIVIAGTGEDFKKYRDKIINIDNFEIINKFLSPQEINDLFTKCSLVVLPYIEASQSGIIPLAYSYKKPVVSTNVGSLPEYILNGITGIMVKSHDEYSLSRALITILKNTKLRKEMGNNGFNFYKQQLSWDLISKETYKIYEKTIFSKVVL